MARRSFAGDLRGRAKQEAVELGQIEVMTRRWDWSVCLKERKDRR